ncbi:LpqB family beta-propeller domain-containing protein [Streptomyces sp. NBC_00094]|uniref:LpqB family beta-propeller domain-containing protein n=1 Tax=Streptomyces sp. NBC_00094 TaxID=2903620 RepID=UPI00225B76CB|nr:LpqB family beta-propeller domain-containing protein [Streptomyces sp. NBC_00094]MCX5391036.1 LpqB family beta-propeller domain-containing protein [Streptomyces sp. NBC_00094]
MPDSGDVQVVKGQNPGDSQVRVYAVAPRENAAPGEIVDGFLEAMTSDDPGFATARKYLTEQAAESWKPEQSITVLTTAPDREPSDRNSDPDDQDRIYPLSGRKIATVDARHAYQPVSPAAYVQSIRVVQQTAADGKSKEWRIDSLPSGLVLGEADFLRNYRSVNKYYFASGEDRVVADPVYIRQRQDPVTRMDPVTQTVKALLEGPTNWLKSAVDSQFPSGTELKAGVTSLTTDDQSTLKVPLNAKANQAGGEACRRMAAQLLFTLGDLTSVRVEQVELLKSTGDPLCRLGKGQAAEFAADHGTVPKENPYFVDAHGKLMKLEVGGEETDEPAEVPGPFGRGTTPLQSVAVDRGETRAAGVGTNGRDLFVSSITTEQDPLPAVLSSKAARPADRLSAPSWDGRGDLWVADRNPAEPHLWMVPDGSGDPVEVRTPWLTDDTRVEALRVSADGVRIALLVTQGERTTLQIGRVERQTTGAEPTVSVVDLQPAAPRMESVTAVSWAGPSRLVVVGKEAGGVQQIRYLQTDGSTSASAVLPGLNGVTSVAAPNGDGAPVVADSGNDGIVRLAPGTNWQPVVKTGGSPVYPG